MTRGCPRKCAFCAVSRLEPEYKDYIGLKEQIRLATERFGPQKDLLLMDNNVFASKRFGNIIDEIKECGFERGAMLTQESEYNIAMNNIREGYNLLAYTRKFIRLYDRISDRLSEAEQADFYLEREKRNGCIRSLWQDSFLPSHSNHFGSFLPFGLFVTDKKLVKLGVVF